MGCHQQSHHFHTCCSCCCRSSFPRPGYIKMSTSIVAKTEASQSHGVSIGFQNSVHIVAINFCQVISHGKGVTQVSMTDYYINMLAIFHVAL